MKIYFSHGKESGPWGTKIKALAEIAKEQGFDVESVDYTDLASPDARVSRLTELLSSEIDKYVLVGSSMGGYVSLVSAAAESVAPNGLFLMAPALYMRGYDEEEYATDLPLTEIVHGWSDDVVLPDNSMRYAKRAQCSLHLIDGDHGLNSSLDVVRDLFRHFLVRAG